MTVELRPETEKFVLKEPERGHFRSVEKVIAHAVGALHHVSEVQVQPTAKQLLGQFLLESPLRNSGIKIEHKED